MLGAKNNHQQNKEALKLAFSEDQKYKEAIGVKTDTSLQILMTGVDFEIPLDELDDQLSWRVEGRLYGRDQQGNGIYYMQVQDLMIIDLLQTNNWLRLIYLRIRYHHPVCWTTALFQN